MRHSSKYTLLAMLSALALTACSDIQPGFESDLNNRIQAQTNALSDKSKIINSGGIVDVDRPFIGRNMTPEFNQYIVDHGKPFPPQLERSDAFEIVVPAPASLEQVELLMQEMTGLNVIVRSPAGAAPISKKIRIKHKGSLSSFVRTIASRFDLAWRFDGETITFNRMDTRSYDLPLPASSGSITASLSGVRVTGNSVSSSKSLTLDPWAELTAALETVISTPGKVTVSRNTGQVTIFAITSAQEEAAKIIKTFDALYSNRIGLEIATFYVDTRRSAELTVDLGVSVDDGKLSASLGRGLVDALQGGIGVIEGSEVSVSFNLQDFAGSNAVTDYQSSNTVTQNGVVAPVVLTNSQKYVSEISATGSADAGPSVSVSTDFIDSGISIYSLPRLMRNGKIHLSVWVTQAELNSLETFDTGTGFVQLPDSDQRAVEYTLIMEPGETLIMGGYEQERSTSSSRGGLGGLGALGLNKSKTGGTTRSRLILMVRPTIIGG